MSNAPMKGDDRKNLFMLRDALKEAGVADARLIAEAIARMVNTKVDHAIGRHHATCHCTTPAHPGSQS